MINQNRQLTEDIRKIKRESFPELRWVYSRGVYVPLSMLQVNNALASVKLTGIEVSDKNGKSCFFGYIRLMIPDLLSPNFHFRDRRGFIAHELSHLVAHSDNEKVADDEAIKRGYLRDLLDVNLFLENKGLGRGGTSYDSQQLMRKVYC